MAQVDLNKPVWRVSGRLPSEGNRRFTCFVNASSEQEALMRARQEELFTIDSVWRIDPLTGKPIDGIDISQAHREGCVTCRIAYRDGGALCVVGASAEARQEQRSGVGAKNTSQL